MDRLDGIKHEMSIERMLLPMVIRLILLKAAHTTTHQAITFILLGHGSTRRGWMHFFGALS